MSFRDGVGETTGGRRIQFNSALNPSPAIKLEPVYLQRFGLCHRHDAQLKDANIASSGWSCPRSVILMRRVWRGELTRVPEWTEESISSQMHEDAQFVICDMEIHVFGPVPHMYTVCTSTVRSLDGGAHMYCPSIKELSERHESLLCHARLRFVQNKKVHVPIQFFQSMYKIFRWWQSEWARHDKKTQDYLSGTEKGRPSTFKLKRCPLRNH
jgi:hypothetical protein